MTSISSIVTGSYLVTGATGFIGSNLVRELVKRKQKVSVIVRNRKLSWRLRNISDYLDIHQSDLQDTKLLEIVNKIKPDYIFHLARYGNLPNEDEIWKMIDINLKGTINLLSAVKNNPFRLFINTGSADEYGIRKTKMRENDKPAPINNNGVIKLSITLYCQKEAIRNSLPIITLRPFTPFGYFEDSFRLIPSVILSAIKNEPIRVSSPESVRDFVFIEDLIDAFFQATRRSHAPGEIYNIARGEQHSVGEIVEMIIKLTKSKSKIEWGAVKKQKRYVEPKRWEADISKAKKVLKWKPNHGISEGLSKTISWFKINNHLYQ